MRDLLPATGNNNYDHDEDVREDDDLGGRRGSKGRWATSNAGVGRMERAMV